MRTLQGAAGEHIAPIVTCVGASRVTLKSLRWEPEEPSDVPPPVNTLQMLADKHPYKFVPGTASFRRYNSSKPQVAGRPFPAFTGLVETACVKSTSRL